MKIKTITCHNVYNYGATLQSFALQSYLAKQGHDVEIIDYFPKYRNKRNFWKIPINSTVAKYTNKYFILHVLYVIHRAIKYYRDTNFARSKKFDAFDKEYLHITTRKYKSFEELISNPPEADCYVAGSDQIWNYKGDTGRDPAFFLNFGKESVKRVSYAASFGVSEIEKDFQPIVKKYLSVLDSISVRENTGLCILKELGYTCAVKVCDPVFLLTKEEWLSIAVPKKITEDYILVYDFFQDDDNIKQMALNLSSKYRCKIVSVNDGGKSKYADENVCDASPNDFITLIANAKVVVSNSFHATAFSLILNTEFYTYPVNRNQNHSRMIDLLKSFDLSERYNAKSVVANIINWTDVEAIINKHRNCGITYIMKNI